MRLSACVEWQFTEAGDNLADRIRAAKAAGFDFAEFHLWRDKDLAGIAGALIAPINTLNPSFGVLFLVNSFLVVIIGGQGSLRGLVTAAVLLGGSLAIMQFLISTVFAQILVLVIAILVGIIPESGPHLIFVTLFAQGSLPFAILLANSIVQDGHGTLPLLAVSRRAFLWLKLVNIAFGFLAGSIGLFLLA